MDIMFSLHFRATLHSPWVNYLTVNYRYDHFVTKDTEKAAFYRIIGRKRIAQNLQKVKGPHMIGLVMYEYLSD